MGLTRSGKHKRKSTGGKRTAQMIRKLNSIARPPSNTKVGLENKRKLVRVRGGNYKTRALRLKEGSFTMQTHRVSLKTAILRVVYHPNGNEFVRANTLTKGCVVMLDPSSFKTKIDEILASEKDIEEIDPLFVKEYREGHLYGIITSRPGQVGVADGYLLQADELVFYSDKFKAKQRK
ncbi:small subunit ribosomal protein S8e [Nematocida sp. AWRm77]|nr:small subunit ribosomal protein S8e [Nematocida sp. AWRm77]